MKKKPSRLLERLDAEIAHAANPLEADCKRAERACYRAREGEIDDAREVLKSLHQRYDGRPHAAISAWLSLAEGLVSHSSDSGAAAKDKIKRAHALSGASGMTSLRGLSAAWLASMAYQTFDFAAVARHIADALNSSAPTDHSTRSLCHLTAAQAYHVAGRVDLAQPCYRRARHHACMEGDDATIGSLLSNMAWLKATNLRQDYFTKKQRSISGTRALMSLQSTEQFDKFWRSFNFTALSQILRAQILSTEGNYESALDLYEKNLDSAVSQGMRRLHADLLADRAWCRLRMGKREVATQDALLAEENIDSNGRFDDRALAHSRLAQVWEELGDVAVSGRHARLATEAWSGHSLLQAEIIERLADVEIHRAEI